MKNRIIHSITRHVPLSELHLQLDKRQNLPYRELFDWRHEHYPPTDIPETRLMVIDTSQEMTDIFIQWYLESHAVKIPYYQYTDEDFAFATHWGEKSMNYITIVLYPVLTELIIHNPQAKSDSTTVQLSLDEISKSLEEICVTWGGY